MSYALLILWYERNRYLTAVLAVAFSGLLVAMQLGLLVGTFSVVSIPIDRSQADVWVGYPGAESVDLGLTIPESWQTRLARLPEVDRTEVVVQGYLFWGRPPGGVEMCVVIGTRLDEGSLGAIHDLTPEIRQRLTEPGSIVVNEGDLRSLGLRGVGDQAEVAGCRVRVVGLVHGVRDLAGPYLLCSLQTARALLRMREDQATFLVARCPDPNDAPAVVRRLRRYDNMSAYTREEWSLHSRLHWLMKTKAGLALLCAAMLGLVVGAVVTSQTLYGAVAASLREYAVLEALGIQTRHVAGLVLSQVFWVGFFGIVLALPVVFGLAQMGDLFGVIIQLRLWLVLFTIGVTLSMALLSGLIALRSLRLVEPALLLR